MRRFVKYLTIAVLMVVGPLSASAQIKEGKTANIKLGPYVQAVTDDSFTVVWLTDKPSIGWVETAPDDGSHFFQKSRDRHYHSSLGKIVIDTLHSVTIKNLERGTTYRYRVLNTPVMTEPGDKRLVFGITSGNNPWKQAPFIVKTLDPTASEANFCVVNDIHAKDDVFRDLMSSVKADSVDFVLFNGDMLSAMDSQEQMIKGYLGSACELFASEIPFYNLRGNHESRGLFSYRHINYFPTTTGEAYYMIRQGPAAILMLDCGEDKPDDDDSYFGLMQSDLYRAQEAEWLKEIVKSKEFVDAPVKIAVLHIPPAKSGWHGQVQITELISPILDEAGIDLMLSGHHHKYSYNEPGTRKSNYPVIINGATEKHVLHVTKDGIEWTRIDRTGAVLGTGTIKVK